MCNGFIPSPASSFPDYLLSAGDLLFYAAASLRMLLCVYQWQPPGLLHSLPLLRDYERTTADTEPPSGSVNAFKKVRGYAGQG
jgi:hypothetical protein